MFLARARGIRGMASYEEELEDRLRRNLAKHTETCRACETSRGADRAASYAEYERRRATIYDEYTRPPHQLVVDDVERVECKVKDDLFASARRQVDESLSTLQKFASVAKQDGSDVTKQLPDVFRALTCVQDLTKTWHCEEHYYCAEYFADHDGYRLVLQAYDPACDLAPQMDMHTHALELFWNCGSTRRARLAQYQQGVLPFILQGLNSGDPQELASSLGALWGLCELSELPVCCSQRYSGISSMGQLDLFIYSRTLFRDHLSSTEPFLLIEEGLSGTKVGH